MVNHKLIRQLSTFEKKEMTKFREFAYSPFHNKHKGIQQLVNYLAVIYPHFSEKNLSKTVLQKELKTERRASK